MPIHTDFFAYHKSIGDEFRSLKDRIRNLIGSSHWLSDGEHKEAVLRNAIRSRLPEIYRVGKGFVCYQNGNSKQLDILITSKQKPTLFKEGDLVIVTADCVEAIIEVKTSQPDRGTLAETLTKLADNVAEIRHQRRDHKCWAGLFVFEGQSARENRLASGRSSDLVRANFDAANRDVARAINCVAYGPDIFSRFWNNAQEQADGEIGGPAWHSYVFYRPSHKGLAPAYFISNLIWQISQDLQPEMRWAFFPDPDRGGKEAFRMHYCGLNAGQLTMFPEMNIQL